MRTDENLSRQSFRFSSEWKRSGAGQLTPEIDTRLAGVEKRGDKLVVHSLSGGERNHFFSNRKGTAFTDLSALSGLDTPADSRGFAVIDYDRDGLPDVALVNANQPLFNLYHNEIPASGSLSGGGMIALRLVGGNNTSTPSKTFTGRDGYGAKVTAALGDMNIIREHRCGDGFAAQHTATMMLGLGTRPSAARVSVRWPSGKMTETEMVPEGTLLTCYENPAEAPGGEAFVRSPYRVKLPDRSSLPAARTPFPTAVNDVGAKPGSKIRVYTSMASWCAACMKHLPVQKHLAEEMAGEPMELIAVPIDDTDDEATLKTYVGQRKPAYRLLAALPPAQRAIFRADLEKLLGHEPGLPSSVITDGAGGVIAVLPGLPTLSQLRSWLPAER